MSNELAPQAVDKVATEETTTFDYAQFDKLQLFKELQKVLKTGNPMKVFKQVQAIKKAYNNLQNAEKKEALKKFLADGGVADDFQMKVDENDKKFAELYAQYIKNRRNQIEEIEQTKRKNLADKRKLLAEFQQLTDAEVIHAADIDIFNDIKRRWQAIGSVPADEVKALTNDFNILVKKFYTNRAIFFDMLELDRRKNLALKQEICDKAERLLEETNLHRAIRQFRKLFFDFREAGPVPREERDNINSRFKAVSEQLFAKAKSAVDARENALVENLKIKNAICEKLEAQVNFASDNIKEWTQKTAEILQIRDEWQRSGPPPRDSRKAIRDRFWTAYKSFFKARNDFFKQLEEKRKENLALKIALCEKAEALKDAENWEEAAQEMKKIQQDWKNIGAEPAKLREKTYKRFKTALDYFFERRRQEKAKIDAEYKENLAKKIAICEKLEQWTANGTGTVEQLAELQNEYKTIGFVPIKKKNEIRARFDEAVRNFLTSINLDDAEKNRLLLEHEVAGMDKDNPLFRKRIDEKLRDVRKNIAKIEDEIAVWRNNMEFFGRSKNAGAIRTEFEEKIAEAEKLLKTFKQQLAILRKV